jgi:hypothetical protein
VARTPLRLPSVAGVVGAAATILWFGATFASDSAIPEDDPKLRVKLVERFKKVVKEQNERLNKATFDNDWSLIQQHQFGLWQSVLEKMQEDDFGTAILLLQLAYGNTLERIVAEAVFLDEVLDKYFKYLAGPNNPDFYGYRRPVISLNIDITTERDAANHLDPKKRPRYGENLLVIVYRWWLSPP